MGDVFCRAHFALLVGYALLGKGFAYLGIAPMYVGELSLALGLAVALSTGALIRIPRSPTLTLLIVFQVWCGVRAASDLSHYGVETLRDSVIWGYGLFAIVTASVLAARPYRLAWFLSAYGVFARLFLMLMPLLWIVYVTYGDALPRVPGTDVGLVHLKSADVLTHLAGIASFQLVGLSSTSIASLVLFWIGCGALSVHTRGGMLAFLSAVGLVCALEPMRRRVWIAAAATLAIVPIVLFADLGVAVRHREISGRQLVDNALSIVGLAESRRLSSTRSWRLDWWSKIVEDTVFGRHFWWGRGFGVNLASDDGFATDRSGSLRSPHNGHMTLLARGGVPAAVLWALLQASWVAKMSTAYRQSRRDGQPRWSKLYLFLLAYWMAYMVNATFDVYLEGPMGGIWFWTLFGIGLAAPAVQAKSPGTVEAGATR